MRILFTTYPERTHFLLMVPLAWALRTAGHEVRFASQPKFASTITQAGLTAVPVGSDRDLWQFLARDPAWLGDLRQGGMPAPYDAALRRPEDVTWTDLVEGYTRQVKRWHMVSNAPMAAALAEFARAWQPDLIIWDPLTYAGPIAAKACGAAHARLIFGTDMYGVTRDHFLRLAAERADDDRIDPMRNWLDWEAHRYGAGFDESMITGQFTIDLVPECLQLRADRTYLPLRHTPYGGPSVVPAWLWRKPERPRVALTLGLSTVGHGGEYATHVQGVLDGLGGLDIDVVATIAESEQRKLTRIPDNTRVVPFAPLDALAATCDAVVHHAGFGTLATTALRGLPHLMLPWDNDGPALADAVARVGAGLVVNPKEATSSAVRDGVQRLLGEPGFRAGARALNDAMLAAPTPNDLVPELERLVPIHRGDKVLPLARSGK